MEFDPMARDVGPPRHEIESDSEDEGMAASSSRKARTFVPPKVQVLHDAAAVATHLVILEGEGGEAFLRQESGVWQESGRVMIDGEQHGALALTSDKSVVVLLLRPSIAVLSEQAKYAYICSAILESLQPSSLTIVGDYNSSLYLSSRELHEAPIRFISTGQTSFSNRGVHRLQPFESPNYVLGLGATLLNESCLTGVPTALFLLPQASNSHLQAWSRIQPSSSSFDTQPDALDADLAYSLAPLLPLHGLQPQTAQGSAGLADFLHSRRTLARRKLAQSASAMYV